MNISKTTFQDYLFCPRNMWLKLHHPELLEKFALSDFEKHLVEQGNEVESYARNLFPGGVEVVDRGLSGCEETVRFIAAKMPAIFQATFIIDGFLARNDALCWNPKTELWDLYEVKGTSDVHDKDNDHSHLDDLAFQASVLKRSNVPVGKYYLVHLNSDYVRSGDLEWTALFKIVNQTEEIIERLPLIEEQMETALKYLSAETEPRKDDCKCIYRGRSKQCATFSHSYQEVPEYSVHDLARIGGSKKKLEKLIEDGIFNIEDVPEKMFENSQSKLNQIKAHRDGKSIIEVESIREELSKLTFPLYFFDYETFGPAIPIFNGYAPYQRIPFQFSLHTLVSPDAEPTHNEYLHEELSDPSENVAKCLSEWIGTTGTVIAWNKSFEGGVNRELAKRLPQYGALMEHINNMLYDLQDIFTKQFYVDAKFKGRTSIKKVQPALVPEFTYQDLVIHEGGQASKEWWRMVSPATPADESADIAKHLKIYCGRDTYAMFVVWRELQKLL